MLPSGGTVMLPLQSKRQPDPTAFATVGVPVTILEDDDAQDTGGVGCCCSACDVTRVDASVSMGCCCSPVAPVIAAGGRVITHS